MNETKNAIVIDKQGYKTTFVLVEFVKGEDWIKKEQPLFYMLKEGESLVYEDISTALSMHKPRWDGSGWVETATPEEIEAAKPEPTEQPPTQMELLGAELSMAIAEQQTQLYTAIAELSMAIATTNTTATTSDEGGEDNV